MFLPARGSADLRGTEGLSSGSLPVRNTGDLGFELESESGVCRGSGLDPEDNGVKKIKSHLH